LPQDNGTLPTKPAPTTAVAPRAKDADIKTPAEPKLPTVKVEKRPFKIEASIKGVFESPEMTEVAIRPEAWTSPMPVVKAVPHGTQVKKGATLIELDFEKLDQAITDLENERRLAQLTLKLAEEELPILEKLTPMELASAERAKNLSEEDLKRFLETDRALAEKSAKFSLDNAKHSVEYAEEELRQLEKMYRDKDIREDTEEIILKRQRRQVENAKFFLSTSEKRVHDTLNVMLPRQEQSLKELAAKSAVAWDKARTTLPLTLRQKHVALAKLKYDSEKSTERLAKLKKDRELLAMKAPADGIVYYGKCVRGQWATAAMIAGKLVRGGTLPAEEVVVTIVNPTGLFVRATVDEKELPNIRTGQKAKVVATANPDVKHAAKVEQVTSVPVTPGNFESKITLDAAPEVGIVPGMACTVKLVPYQNADALTVPAGAVFTDDLDDDKQYVLLPQKNGKPEKKTVKVGKTSGGKTEITTGLQEGDEILTEKPGGGKQPSAMPVAPLGQ
jgi:multidrug efflux pump subunit AcrA (membrane-fusion protein)